MAEPELDEARVLMSGLLQHHDELVHPSPPEEDVTRGRGADGTAWCLVAEAARLWLIAHGETDDGTRPPIREVKTLWWGYGDRR